MSDQQTITTPAAVVSRASDQPLAGGVRFALTAEQTGGPLDLGAEVVRRGEGPPMHIHDHMDEYVLVMSGSLRCRVDGEDIDLEPGDAATIPRGCEHTFTNVHEEDCQVVFALTPGGFHPFLAELDAAASFDPEVVGPIGARHGHRMTGPPLAVALGLAPEPPA